MKKLAVLLIILAAAAAAVYGGYRYWLANPGVIAQIQAVLGFRAESTEATPLDATGIIEGDAVLISTDVGGRITDLAVSEGDPVVTGQLLLSLDDSLPQAQIHQADAAVAVAQAQLDLLQAGPRSEEVDHARALLAQALAAQRAAKQAWDDAILARDTPQALQLAIVEAETAAVVAQHVADAVRLEAEASDLQVNLWGRVTKMLTEGFDVPLPGGSTLHVDSPAERAQANVQWNLAGQRAWEAWQNAYAAEESTAAAYTALADLRRQRDNPIILNAQVNLAEAAFRQALAAVDQAMAGLRVTQEGATPAQIEVARQALEQARAARDGLDVLLAKTQINAPQLGVVGHVAVHPGEVALPGSPLLEINDLSEVTLTVFVPEPSLGRVWTGQAVSVTVDSFPSRVFRGTVSRIADEAEFTPKNVQTREERVNTVFAVEVTLPNPDYALKPGMPADAVFAD